MTAAGNKHSFLSARYKRIMTRRGYSRALVALAGTILETCWHLLSTNESYHDHGADYYTRRRPAPPSKRPAEGQRSNLHRHRGDECP
jgi:transposase